MLTAAIVGAGTPPEERDSRHYGQGYEHARGYQRAAGAELVACVDTDAQHARRFALEFGLEDRRVFDDHAEMLRTLSPNLVSVCTPPETHPDIVRDCVDAGVTAIHCEKPLAATWGACRETAAVCDAAGVVLTVNHQRRFALPFRRAKALLDDGEIGDLKRICFRARNLFDYGLHLFDLCGYVTDGVAVDWVLADLAYETENRWYGVHNENRALAQWVYESGVEGYAVSGDPEAMDARLRLVGTDGRIEVEPDGGPVLRVGRPGEWQRVSTRGETIDKLDPGSVRGVARRIARNLPSDWFRRQAPASYTERGVVDLVTALQEGRKPELVADHSLTATELVFACYESARRGARVALPLDVDDNPLESMVDSGRLDPTTAE
jgi:predicted dehydrogenase